MYLWSSKRKRAPDGRLIKNKSNMYAHGGMQQWGGNYWETYSPVVNWVSATDMINLIIIRELQTN